MTLAYTVKAAPVLFPVAKTRVFLGTTASSPVADAFTEIGSVLSIPNFGPTETPIKIQTIGDDLELTLKGNTTIGGGNLECAMDITDAGQIALVAAQAVKTGNYNLRIIFPNGPTGNPSDPTTSHGTIKDIKVLIMSAEVQEGTANNPTKQVFSLGFNSLPSTIAAA